MPSSVINHFSYDEHTKSLKITFVTGMVYRYQDVPEKTYKMLKASISKGRYFNRYIKEKFKFQKLNDL
ncbi:KTSC domain-containing protein [Pedobacter sp. GSP4]|uniref:KTSC domain-containing protein n=1 Tax=Pedobacter sp. GSP4 TaxID=3453716 RepID=UPI003EE9F26E